MPSPTFTNLTAGGASSAASFNTASITPTGNRLILVSVHAYISTGSTAPAQPTVTGNGITYTVIGTGQDVDAAGTDRARMWIFRGMSASPTAGAVTISFGSAMTRCFWSVDQSDANVDTTGTNGSGAIAHDPPDGFTASGTVASISVTYAGGAIASNNSGFAAVCSQTNQAKTPRSGWTELADTFPVTTGSLQTQYLASTDTAASASWTTAARAGIIALEILGASSVVNFTQTPTDSEGLTDTGTAIDHSETGTDPVTLVDSSAFAQGKSQADTVGLSDSVTVAGPARFLTAIAGTGNQQYPVDQSGDPFLVKGDVIWAFPANAGRWNGGDWQGDITSYLNVRQGQGFNLLMFGALGSTQNGGPSDTGNTWDGVSPWASGVKGNLNTTYWDRVDYIIDQAAARGITCLMNVAYSYDMDTAALNGATNTQYTNYGTNLGNRYKTKPNLIWGVGGDYFDTQQTQIGNLFTAIEATGDTHLKSVQNYPETTSRKDISNNGTQNTGVSWSDWNFVYSYNVTYDGVEYAYDEASPIMAIWGDGHFDQNSSGDRVVMRNDVWWALSSGARGHIYGSEGTWNWQSGALSNASTETVPSTDLAGFWGIFTGLTNWWKLVPDTDSSFVTAGRGTHAAALSSGGGGGEYNSADPQDQYVTASVAPDGSLAVVYSPVAHTITVNPAEMAGTYTVRKVDPANGSSSSVAISGTYAISGTNSRGGTDWLLVFESVGGSNFTQTPADAEGLTDSLAVRQDKTATDTESLTDSVVTAAGSAQGPTDTLGVTDAAALSRSLAAPDTVGLTDSTIIEKALTQSPTDTEGLTDSASLVLNYQQALTDAEGLTDSAQVQLAGAGSVSPADSLGITDQTVFNQTHSLTETEGLTDAVSADQLKTAADSENLTDAAQVSLSGVGTVSSTDNLGMSDTAGFDQAHVIPDSIGLTDSALVVRVLNPSDTEGLTDTPSLAVGAAKADTLGIADVVSISGAASMADSTGLTDSVTLLLDTVRSIIDNAALSDLVLTQLNPVVDVTPRPNTGTTSRPGTGRTPRPYTGTTSRP